MTEYKRLTKMNEMRQYNCRTCSMYMRCKCYNDCEIETYCRLQKLEDLIDAGKLIYVDANDDEMVQIKVSRSWLKEMHRILHEKDIDC